MDFQLWRARDLDHGSGHTAYRRASLIDLYVHAKCHWNRRNFLWTDERTHVHRYVRIDIWDRRPALLGQLCRRVDLKTTRLNFTKFSVQVTCGCGSVLLWQKCNMLCTSGFVDDIMKPIVQNQRQRYVSSSSRGGGTSRMSDDVMFGWVCQVAAPGAKLLSMTAGLLNFESLIWHS